MTDLNADIQALQELVNQICPIQISLDWCLSLRSEWMEWNNDSIWKIYGVFLGNVWYIDSSLWFWLYVWQLIRCSFNGIACLYFFALRKQLILNQIPNFSWRNVPQTSREPLTCFTIDFLVQLSRASGDKPSSVTIKYFRFGHIRHKDF